jgi:hypothetical protein
MKQKKESIILKVGLVSVCLLSIYYAVHLYLNIFRTNRIIEKSSLIDAITPLLIITTLISARYIIIVISNARQFKKNLDPLIFVQLISTLLVWAVQLDIFSLEQLIIPFFIIGLIGFVFLLWFVFTLAETEDNEVVGLSFLKYFVIIFLLFFVIKISPDILTIITKRVFKSLDNTIHFIDGLKYIILIPFFVKNLRFLKSRSTNTSA